MNPLLALTTLLAVLAAQGPAGDAQVHPLRKPVLGSGVKDSAPVTSSEARATFVRVEQIMRRTLQMADAKPAVSIASGSTPVRRDQIVAEMTRQYDLMRPKVKLTPFPVHFDPAVLSIRDPKQKANLAMLIRLGAVARIGPLATNKSDTISAPDFGDAIGFFLARMAEITHQPSSKWTPWLRDEGE